MSHSRFSKRATWGHPDLRAAIAKAWPETYPCCDKGYFCPRVGEFECPEHGGFDVCCDKTYLHIDRDVALAKISTTHG